MHFIPLSLWSLSLGLALTVLCIAGIVASLELFSTIFPNFVTSANEVILEALYRSVVLAAIVFSGIAILHLLTGGDINAL